jgi:hypothetical protein
MEIEINHKSNKIIKVDIGINTDDEYFKNFSNIYLSSDKNNQINNVETEKKIYPKIENEQLSVFNNFDKNLQNDIQEIPIKKKKGRKSKKVKQMEQELLNEKKVENIRLFPSLNEKIFDLVKINSIEYFYDSDFNVLLNEKVEPIGYKNEGKYIFYSEEDKKLKKITLENTEVYNIMKLHSK